MKHPQSLFGEKTDGLLEGTQQDVFLYIDKDCVDSTLDHPYMINDMWVYAVDPDTPPTLMRRMDIKDTSVWDFHRICTDSSKPGISTLMSIQWNTYGVRRSRRLGHRLLCQFMVMNLVIGRMTRVERAAYLVIVG